MPVPIVRLPLTPDQWDATGDFNDAPAHTRLHGPIIDIAGTYHHLMAIEIEERDDTYYACNAALQPDLEAVFLLNGDCPATTILHGRHYIVCLYPHAV